MPALTEQHVPEWDRVNPRTGVLEEARLDVATRDAITGHQIYIDVSVTCAHSSTALRQRARFNHDGLAAVNAADSKRERYPPAGGELVPLIFEAAGRPGAETVALVRSWGHDLEPAQKTETIRYAWQQLSTLLQTGNAEVLLATSARL